jgi:adenylate kinase family enzyme
VQSRYARRRLTARFTLVCALITSHVFVLLLGVCLCCPSPLAGSDYSDVLTDCAVNGRVVPSTIVLSVLSAAMAKAEAGTKRWMIADFPYSLDQAFDFERTAGMGSVSLVVNLTGVSDATLLARLTDRARNATPAAARPDDNKESVRKRLVTFKEDVVGVIEQYRLFKKVADVSAEGDADTVYARLKPLFEPPKPAPVVPVVVKRKPKPKPPPEDD